MSTSPDIIKQGVKAASATAKFGGYTVSITPAITTSAGAYTANDVVGSALVLQSAVRVAGGTCLLKSIVVKDNANQKADLTILIFNSDPSGATTTDNSAFAWGSTSFPNCIAKFNIAAADYETIDSKAIATIDTVSTALQGGSTVNLWAVVITTGTPTYAANATTLYVTFSFLQD